LLDAAAELGRTTAQMHTALASATGDELAPRASTAADVATWASAVGQEAQATTASMARSGYQDVELQRAIEGAQVYPPPAVEEPGLQTRVHGDYHLGQTIRGEHGFMILDFEGEPARPLVYRRRHQHPLVDVAGMTRSWGYAAHAAAEGHGPDAPIAALESALRDRFLVAYWSEADTAPRPFLPPDKDSRTALLRLFELTKALYEVRYELDNRPAMVKIPGDAIKRLMHNG
jgi:trehalose synthase-fused probable maltokinase